MNGYASHLNDLTAYGGAKPVLGNVRLVIRKGCFGLPGQLKRNKSSKKMAKRAASLPPLTTSPQMDTVGSQSTIDATCVQEPVIGVNQAGNTTIRCGGPTGSGKAVKPRGTSPRTKIPASRYESKV